MTNVITEVDPLSLIGLLSGTLVRPTFTNEELAMINYKELKSHQSSTIEKVINSIIYNPLTYENTVEERITTWLTKGSDGPQHNYSIWGSSPVIDVERLDNKGVSSQQGLSHGLLYDHIIYLIASSHFEKTRGVSIPLRRQYAIITNDENESELLLERFNDEYQTLEQFLENNTDENLIRSIILQIFTTVTHMLQNIDFEYLAPLEVVVVPTSNEYVSIWYNNTEYNVKSYGRRVVFNNISNSRAIITINNVRYAIGIKNKSNQATTGIVVSILGLDEHHPVVRKIIKKKDVNFLGDLFTKGSSGILRGVPIIQPIGTVPIEEDILEPLNYYLDEYAIIRLIYIEGGVGRSSTGSSMEDQGNPLVRCALLEINNKQNSLTTELKKLSKKSKSVLRARKVLDDLKTLYRQWVYLYPDHYAVEELKRFIDINESTINRNSNKT